MRSELFVALVVILLDCRVFDRAVHAFNLAICPRVVWLGQTILNAIWVANHVEPHGPRIGGVPVARLLAELNAIVRQYLMDFVWYRFQHDLQKLPSCLAVGFVDQLCDGKLAGSVNCHKEIQLALAGTKLRDIDGEVANRIAFEFCRLGLSPFISGNRDMPCRCKQRCNEERVRCGIVGCKA